MFSPVVTFVVTPHNICMSSQFDSSSESRSFSSRNAPTPGSVIVRSEPQRERLIKELRERSIRVYDLKQQMLHAYARFKESLQNYNEATDSLNDCRRRFDLYERENMLLWEEYDGLTTEQLRNCRYGAGSARR